MTNKRESDLNKRTWFRTGRMFKDNGTWYFHTREKTIEGPYQSEMHAEMQLEIYIRLQNSSFLANDHNFELIPLDINKSA